MALYTTLNKIRAAAPCQAGYKKLLTSLRKTEADDEPVSFQFILESNGFEDAIWCIRTAPEYKREWNIFLALCLESIQHIMKDRRSIAVIAALRENNVTEAIRHDAAAAADFYAAAAASSYAADADDAAAAASSSYAAASSYASYAAAAAAAASYAYDAYDAYDAADATSAAATYAASSSYAADATSAARLTERKKQVEYLLSVVQ